MSTIGLVMIVRDEEAVIERALLSVIPFISTWVIVDTGSTDRTKEIIQRLMAEKGIPGLLADHPWVSFGTNRSQALALCDNRMDWAIMLDADDTMIGTPPPPEVWTNDQIDAFALHLNHGGINHIRTQIYRTGRGWIYEGVIHEHARCSAKTKPVIALLPPSIAMETRCEGYRSKDPQKYIKDALILEKEYMKNPADHRTIFYLAQSYRDAGQRTLASQYYQCYLDTLGGSDQECYMSLVNLILLADDPEKVFALTWRAIVICPDRLEAQYTLLNQRRQRSLPLTQQCYAIATASSNRKMNPTFLFSSPGIYQWGMDDELAVVAFATKHYRESYEASLRCVMSAPNQEMQDNALSNAKKAFLLI